MFEAPDPALGARVLARLPVMAQVPEVEARFAQGQLRCCFGTDESLLVTTDEPWRLVLAGAGPEGALLALLEVVRGESEALLWDEETLPLAPSALSARGYEVVLRQSFLQDLERLADDSLPEGGGVEYLPCEGRWVGPAKRLFGRTHAFSVEGLYSTMPTVPTAFACERVFANAWEDRLVPQAAFVAVLDGQVVGEVTANLVDGEAHPLLMTLAVDPSARGRGLSRGLVRRCQRGLRDAGYRAMRFLTTERNAPVHHLFTSGEITETTVTRAWFTRR
jgi:ribosomal protein S18 acetylase RimI-like enzyme